MNVSTNLFNNRNIAAVGISSALIVSALPVQAQSTPTADIGQVTTTVTGLGTVAAIAIPIVLSAMGVRLAIKLVNRFAVKG